LYPLRDSELTVGDLAKHWQLTLPGRPELGMVITGLIQAIWTGELSARFHKTSENDIRLRLLNIHSIPHCHPGLIFVEAPTECPAVAVEQSDGGAIVSIQTCIIWPQDPEAQDAATFLKACKAMQAVSFDDVSPDVQPLLLTLNIGRCDFVAFCARRGYEPPAFWDSRKEAKSFVGAKNAFRKFLLEAVKSHKDKSKDQYWFKCKT